jgi:Leucine-rich repeat (LRR) protein
LKKLPKSLGALTSLKELDIDHCSIQKLPRSIGQLSQLQTLTMKRCKNLQKLSTSIKNLQGLQRFSLQDCGNIEAMGALTILQGLPIWGSTSITTLPASLGIALILEVYGDNLKLSQYYSYQQIVGTSQLLEEDESGFLEAYHNKSGGKTSLVRGMHYIRAI